MIRLSLPILIVLLLLSACLPLQNQKVTSKPAAEDPALNLFIEGIDHFDSSHRSQAFLQLEEQHPDSSWNRRAKTLASLAGTIRLLEKQLDRQQTIIKEQNGYHLTLVELRKENEVLREQVKILKSLIVDLELRQP